MLPDFLRHFIALQVFILSVLFILDLIFVIQKQPRLTNLGFNYFFLCVLEWYWIIWR